jgi:hypothetical protein
MTDTRRPFSKYIRLGTAGVLVLVAAACSTSDPIAEPQFPDTAVDSRVTELLPIGAYQLEFDAKFDGPMASHRSGSGYIELPEDYNMLDGCAYDITFKETFPRLQREEVTQDTKSRNGYSWTRLVSGESDYREVGRWTTADDIEQAGGVFLELPIALAFGSAEEGRWCSVRRIDQIANLSDPATGVLRWDPEAITGLAEVFTQTALYTQVMYRPLEGISKREAERARRTAWDAQAQVPGPEYKTVQKNQQLRITREGERLVLSYYKTGTAAPYARFVFTPTAVKEIADVKGIPTYREKLQTQPFTEEEFTEGE